MGGVVVLEGAFNFRDLGGLPTVDGGVTRQGLLFRSDTLQALTPQDVATLQQQVRLRSVVDLRLEAEVLEHGLGPLAGAVGYHHAPLPMASVTAVPHGHVLDPLYEACLESPHLAAALTAVIRAADAPVLFHCVAGKDRTGILAALLLSLAGVDEQRIVADYLRSRPAMPRIVDRLKRWPYYRRHIEATPPAVYDVDESPLRALLAVARDRYGGVEAWARAKGVDEGLLHRFRQVFVA